MGAGVDARWVGKNCDARVRTCCLSEMDFPSPEYIVECMVVYSGPLGNRGSGTRHRWCRCAPRGLVGGWSVPRDWRTKYCTSIQKNLSCYNYDLRDYSRLCCQIDHQGRELMEKGPCRSLCNPLCNLQPVSRRGGVAVAPYLRLNGCYGLRGDARWGGADVVWGLQGRYLLPCNVTCNRPCNLAGVLAPAVIGGMCLMLR